MRKLFLSLFVISPFLSFGTVHAADTATISGQITGVDGLLPKSVSYNDKVINSKKS